MLKVKSGTWSPILAKTSESDVRDQREHNHAELSRERHNHAENKHFTTGKDVVIGHTALRKSLLLHLSLRASKISDIAQQLRRVPCWPSCRRYGSRAKMSPPVTGKDPRLWGREEVAQFSPGTGWRNSCICTMKTTNDADHIPYKACSLFNFPPTFSCVQNCNE